MVLTGDPDQFPAVASKFLLWDENATVYDGEDRAHLERRSFANESCLKGDRICRHCNEDNSHIRILCRDQLLECLILRRPMLYDLYSASNNQGGFLLVILYTSCFVTFLSQICWLD